MNLEKTDAWAVEGTKTSVGRPLFYNGSFALEFAPSNYGTASPSAELIGNAKSPLPTRMVTRKLSNMICVVESVNFFFLTIRFSSKKHKGTNVLCSQLVPFIFIRFCNYIIFCRLCQLLSVLFFLRRKI